MTTQGTAENQCLREALAAARGTILDLRSHLSDLHAAQDYWRSSCEVAKAKQEAAEQRAATVLAELAALREQYDALAAERDWLRNVRDELEAQLQKVQALAEKPAMPAAEQPNPANAHTELPAQGSDLMYNPAVLGRLVRELRWDDGPRALRTVLPLARLLRRIARREFGPVAGIIDGLSQSPRPKPE